MKKKPQLFLLHYAGGSRFSFDFLLPFLQEFDVHRLELPGRGKRIGETLLSSVEEAVEDYLKQILSKRSDAPFLIFGHSMGASIGAYTTQRLEALGHYPEKLILSGNPGPGIGQKRKRHLMEKDEFVLELKRIGGMPVDFFNHPELVDFFIPILKADFEIIEKDHDIRLLPLRTSIHALMGNQEKECLHIRNWKRFTRSEFTCQILEGNHFFIHQHPREIASIFNICLHQNI
jgi:surfactin synthase thioesterase subunit